MGSRTLRLAIAACLGLFASGAWAACSDTTVELRGDWGMARFTVEVADEPAEWSLGLMNRPSMPSGAGMIFLYDPPRRASFWMKNTLIPLDMIFIGADGVVRRIHENARPLDESPIDGGSGVAAVLEINGGLSEALGIAVGSEVRHPHFDPALAAWPC